MQLQLTYDPKIRTFLSALRIHENLWTLLYSFQWDISGIQDNRPVHSSRLPFILAQPRVHQNPAANRPQPLGNRIDSGVSRNFRLGKTIQTSQGI